MNRGAITPRPEWAVRYNDPLTQAQQLPDGGAAISGSGALWALMLIPASPSSYSYAPNYVPALRYLLMLD